MHLKTLFIMIVLIMLYSSCERSLSPDINPDWLNDLVTEFKNAPVGNPPQSIWRYTYKGRIVYYVPAQCCDQFSTLYDAKGSILCAPDGGFSGQGDGHCPDFFAERKDEHLVWRDPRGP
ncbi:MAG: hypothetical protein U5R06_12240 [candidate division KSB1 bacterium]|nr:hypothetical protein [candidate division KSB1 bacterium]